MKGKKTNLPVGIKILLIILAAGLLVQGGYILIFFAYHYPSDSLTNYPGTEWRCDKLGIDLVVDDDGNITGSYETETGVISLNVIARSSTSWHTNYIVCVDSTDDTQIIYLHGFYRLVEDGLLYVTIYSKQTTVDMDAVTEWMPYKFVKR